MITTKVHKVDGETRVAIFVDGVFKNELDTHSQLSVKDAKEILIEQYSK